MCFLALLLVPWAHAVQTAHTLPRILADDISITGLGQGGYDEFMSTCNATHQYLQDMGAQVAPKKCYLFSSHSETRT